MAKKPTSPADMPFEDALAQLEQIVERIEGGEVGLEAALAEYERGVGLLKRCREVLKHAEQRVEELSVQVRKLDGAGTSKGAAGGSVDVEGADLAGDDAAPF